MVGGSKNVSNGGKRIIITASGTWKWSQSGGMRLEHMGNLCLNADYHSLNGRTQFIRREEMSKKRWPHFSSVQAYCPYYITQMLICTLKKLQPYTSIEKLLASTFMAPSTSIHKAIIPFHGLVCTSFCNEILHSQTTLYSLYCRRCL